jgi:hypothetical protein
MLPRSSESRTDREAAKGRQGGRTHEIQRLIGRSLRAVTDLSGFGERQIKVDCDVIQADGGTRTAAITGGFVALHLAFQHLKKVGAVTRVPLTDHVAAISCGVVGGRGGAGSGCRGQPPTPCQFVLGSGASSRSGHRRSAVQRRTVRHHAGLGGRASTDRRRRRRKAS